MLPKNHALIFSTPKSHSSTIGLAPYSFPSAGELVIKTHAVALNPADWAIQRRGVLIPEEDGYPCIVGCDVAGEVVELPKRTEPDGPSKAEDDWINNFKIGDRVIGQTGPLFTKASDQVDLSPPDLNSWDGKKVYAYAAFQTYVVLRGPMIAKIPDHISYEDAAVLPIGIATATSCLFPQPMLDLEMPPLSGVAQKKNKILLVWGASSSVGSSGVQLATQAGYDVIGICSARNHEMVLSLGATKCFDHKSPDIVADTVEYLKFQSKEVVGAYDGISTLPTLGPLCEILHQSSPNARKFIAAVFPGADQYSTHDVQIVVNITHGLEQFYASAGKIRVWLEEALKDGRLKCMPEKDVLGKGLEYIQGGMDRLAEMKVSGRKLVVSL